MATEWPNTSEIAAAIEAGDSSSATETTAAPAATGVTAGADAVVDKIVTTDVSKTQGTPTTTKPSETAKTAETTALPSDLAARIKEDPRKFLATLPEDAIESMQAILYPKLHQTLSKRDTAHQKEIARLTEMSAAQVAALEAKMGERFDDILARTMEPEAFEEFKRDRTAKADAEKQKNAPKPEEVARQAELQAFVTQAWDVIADEGFAIPSDRVDFSDMTEDVKAIWQAGWGEKTPLAGVRAMRSKARELKSGTAAKTPTTPRDPTTGKFVGKTDAEFEAAITERVNKALEERDLRAGLAVTGSRPGAAAGATGGKAPTWDENRRALADALRNS